MLVEYSDSEEEGAKAAPALIPAVLEAPQPPAKKLRKVINLHELLQRNGGAEIPLEDAAKLPAGFFDADAEKPAADEGAPPKTGWAGLSAMLPPPKHSQKSASQADSLCHRAKPTQRNAAAAATSSAAASSAGASSLGTGLAAQLPPTLNLVARPDASLYSVSSSSDAYANRPATGSLEDYMQPVGGERGGVSAVTESLEDYMQPARHAVAGFGTSAQDSVRTRDAIPKDLDEGKVVSVSQADLKKTIGPAREFEIQRPKEDVQIAAQFWNRKTGSLEATCKPNRLQKRKHQINALAHDCKEKAVELAQRARMGLKTKKETQAKYGW